MFLLSKVCFFSKFRLLHCFSDATLDQLTYILKHKTPADAIQDFASMLRCQPVAVVHGIIWKMLRMIDIKYVIEAAYHANIGGSVILANLAYRTLCHMDDLDVCTATAALSVCYRCIEYLPDHKNMVDIFERVMLLVPFEWKCVEAAFKVFTECHLNFSPEEDVRLVSCLYSASAEMISGISDETIHMIGCLALFLSCFSPTSMIWHMVHDYIVALERFLRRGSDKNTTALETLRLFIKLGQAPESYSQPTWPMLLNAIGLTVCKLETTAMLDANQETMKTCHAIMVELTQQVSEWSPCNMTKSSIILSPSQINKCDSVFIKPIVLSFGLVTRRSFGIKQEDLGCMTPLLDELGIYICSHYLCLNLSCDTEFQIKTYVCGGCNKARYCSRDCQAADWKSHKKECIT